MIEEKEKKNVLHTNTCNGNEERYAHSAHIQASAHGDTFTCIIDIERP